MANVNTPTKSPGNTYTSSELNTRTNWINSPMTSLGTFNPAMTFDSQGNYSDYTPAASEVVTFSATSIIAGNVRKVKVILDGSQTLVAGTNTRLLSGSLGQLSAGTYDVLFGSFDSNEVLISIPGSSAAPVAVTFSNFRIESANPDRVLFDASSIWTGTTFAGFTLATPTKTITSMVNNGTIGNYFVVSAPYTAGDTGATIAYDGTDDITSSGGDLAAFTATSIQNNLQVIPQWQTGSFEIGIVADNIVVLPVDVALDTGSVPAVGDFDIQVDSSPNVVTNVDLSTALQVRLTLTTSVTNGQTVTAAYTAGTNPIRSNATQDNAANFTATAVTNNVGVASKARKTQTSVGDNYFVSPNTTYLNITSDWSVSGWFQVKAYAGINIIAKRDLAGNEWLVDLGGASFAVRGLVADSVTGNSGVTRGVPNLDQWYHYYLEYDSATKQAGFSIDNETLVKGSAITNVPRTGLAKVHVGVSVNSGPTYDTLDCYHDDIAFWNRKLTTAERTWLFNKNKYADIGTGGGANLATDFVAWYECDENVNEDLLDAGGGTNLSEVGQCPSVPGI